MATFLVDNGGGSRNSAFCPLRPVSHGGQRPKYRGKHHVKHPEGTIPAPFAALARPALPAIELALARTEHARTLAEIRRGPRRWLKANAAAPAAPPPDRSLAEMLDIRWYDRRANRRARLTGIEPNVRAYDA